MKDQHEPITVVHQAFADSLDSRAKLGRPNCQYLPGQPASCEERECWRFEFMNALISDFFGDGM
jgi:hypothetical protein